MQFNSKRYYLKTCAQRETKQPSLQTRAWQTRKTRWHLFICLGKVKLCLLNNQFTLNVELLWNKCNRNIFCRLSILKLNPYTNLIMFEKKIRETLFCVFDYLTEIAFYNKFLLFDRINVQKLKRYEGCKIFSCGNLHYCSFQKTQNFVGCYFQHSKQHNSLLS